MAKRSPNLRKPLVISLLVLLLIVAVGYGFVKYRQHNSPPASIAQTTSKATTAQKNYTSGSSRPVSNQNSASQGGAIDQNGAKVSVATGPSSWTSSQSGAITLKQPTDGATLQTGDVISGSATVNPVQYRLVDDQSGVIAQGALNVVDGTFTGKLQFKAYSHSGKLTLFSFDPQNGTEVNRLQITVKLNP